MSRRMRIISKNALIITVVVLATVLVTLGGVYLYIGHQLESVVSDSTVKLVRFTTKSEVKTVNVYDPDSLLYDFQGGLFQHIVDDIDQDTVSVKFYRSASSLEKD